MNSKDDIVERMQGVLDNTTLYDNATRAMQDGITRIQSDAKRIAELEAEVERLRPKKQCEHEWIYYPKHISDSPITQTRKTCRHCDADELESEAIS